MSRARGGGRGRGGSRHKIGGQEMPWDYDPDLDVKSNPQEMFPSMGDDFPRARSPTRKEQEIARYAIALRERIHRGPLYTVLPEHARISKDRRSNTAKSFNPFSDMPTYSQRYKQRARHLPDFSTRTYPVDSFPEELRDVFDPSRKPAKPANQPARRPRQSRRLAEDENALDNERQGEEDEEKQSQGARDDDEEPDEADPDPDENFEDDDDEMAGDYNAEAYFSGGEGDGDDFGMDNDGGGADFD